MADRRSPALIVGGGPAGSSAAILLARAAVPHLLIERSRAPEDALCGGFLSWRTLDALALLGVDAADLGPARVSHVRLFAGDRMIEARLPGPARGVSRRHLDALLIARATAAGAAIERGVAATRIERAADGVGYDVQLRCGAAITADTLFLANGKHEVRGAARTAPRTDDPTLGLRVRLGPTDALRRLIGSRVELFLFDRGYAGLVIQEDGSANLCMALHRSRLTEAGSPARLLARLGAELPRLGDRLAFGIGAPVDAVANVPYGWRTGKTAPGLFRLGDQAGVIPSLAGEGMGIAVASGIRAAGAYRLGGGAAAQPFQAAFGAALAGPMRVAGAIRVAAERPALAGALLPIAGRIPAIIDLLARVTRIDYYPLDRPVAAQES